MNRSEQNRALRTLIELGEIMPKLQVAARDVILRNRFSSGQTAHRRGELAEMEGVPVRRISDPTGEAAAWADDELADKTGEVIDKMADSLSKWLAAAKWILALSGTDVTERAKRTNPDCVACGDSTPDKVRAGFDPKCYTRWLRAGRPDRGRFISQVRAEREAKKDDDKGDVFPP